VRAGGVRESARASVRRAAWSLALRRPPRAVRPRGVNVKGNAPSRALVPVTRMELTGIEAKRYSRTNERHGNIRIDHNSTVTLVREQSPQEAVVEFRYTATYGPIGVIRIEGNMVFQCDAKAFEAQWRSTNQMSPENASEIHSTVMRVCVPQAVGIAKDLQLPPPIPLPTVQFQTPQQAQKGGTVHGPEVM